MPRNQRPQVLPSKSPKGKRKLDLQGESRRGPSPKKQRGNNEDIILSKVKDIMRLIDKKLHDQDNTALNVFLRTKIKGLTTDKKELIGVFGRTGAGKSSLINAIIETKGLLPTGMINACTSAMIKVEANPNKDYEADIEFIQKKDWEDEVSSMKQFLGENKGQRNDEYRGIAEKLSALYGEEWKRKFPEKPVDIKYFKEIKEFLQSTKKTLKSKSAKELSAKLIKYTRSESSDGGGQEVQRCYWPVVKCVTLKVPHNDLLQHVTLVDLPGCGDRNKSRDEMWKKIIRDCCTVWIVSEISRPADDKEPWEILKNTCSHLGNGGECQRIHFICTKSDHIDDSDDDSEDDVGTRTENTIKKVKDKVKQEFEHLDQKHFGADCFKVFAVSSKNIWKKDHPIPKHNEMAKLRDFLRDLNDCHSEALNYVSGAYGLLSLMQGARSTELAGKKKDVCEKLKVNLSQQLRQVEKAVEDAHRVFETRLTQGVEKSKRSCEQTLESIIYPPDRTGSSFHRTLKCVVENDGVHKPKEGEQINLNAALASWLTDSIDEEFRKTFPNADKRGSFNGAIRKFSLDTEKLTQENQSLKLQLIFLQTVEEIMKTTLLRAIWDNKKTIYSSLTETIEENMKDCYKKAAAFSGKYSMTNMIDTIEEHVRRSKDTMFEEAKAAMLKKMIDLKRDILVKLQKTLEESIHHSLKTDDSSIPAVQKELKMVKKYYDELKRDDEDEETSELGSNPEPSTSGQQQRPGLL